MFLRVQLTEAVNGYWDGGKKSVFDFKIDGPERRDKRGSYVRIGSIAANHWFHVSVGKTVRDTLNNVKRKLSRTLKKKQIEATFTIMADNGELT